MENDVYIDLLFLINFSMDFLCLYITAGILHRKKSPWRLILASALGGIYSVVSLCWGIGGILSFSLDIVSCLVICAVAFAGVGGFGAYMLSSLLFVGVSMMTGGCMSALFNLLNRIDLPLEGMGEDGISVWAFALLAIAAGLITLLGGRLISGKTSVRDCELSVEFDGKTQTYHALCDSGNLVRDPISGRAVIFLDRQASNGFFDADAIESFKNGVAPKNHSYSTMRLIPINTVSGSSVIVALLPQRLTVTVRAKKEKSFCPDALIAFTDIGRSADGHNAVVPCEIIKF